WCHVCAASAHQLRWFRRMTGDSIAVVLVALDWQSASEVAEYVQRHRLTLPVAMGNVAAREEFRIRGYPTYYVLDSQGRVASADVGLSTAPGLWLRTRGLE
ncbi:MAG TPA: TlpA disulfide reductase family protein, partial [Steroidobacteraceae bacterium]|nr:TlpA disulfide reductase family protein [Steroidobacteraceae bacterium]